MTDDASPENLRKFLESDDPALVLMGLSMAKGAGVPDDILEEILWMYMVHDDKKIRAAAKSAFIKLAPKDAKQAVKENWKASYGTERDFSYHHSHRIPRLSKALCQTSVSLVGQLIKALGDKDEDVREAAVDWLHGFAAEAGKIGDARAVEPLIKVLIEALDEFISLSEMESSIRVDSQLYDEDYEEIDDEDGESWYINTDTGELVDLDQKQIDWLDNGISEMSVYWPAAEALGEIGDKRAVEPLIKALGYDDEYVRKSAAEALGKIGDLRAVEPFIKALGDEHNKVRIAATEALEALDELGWVPETDGQRAAYLVASGDCESLVEWGEPAVEPLIGLLSDRLVRDFTTDALGKIGKPAVEPLIKALEEGNSFAAKALGEIGDARAVEPLIKALEDEDLDWQSAEALGEIGDSRAVEPLIKALEEGNSFAAGALGEIGDARAVEPLIKALEDEDLDWRVRMYATKALGEIGDTRAVEPLIELLGDEDGDVAKAAKEALGNIGEPAVEPLIKVLGDDNQWVRMYAAEALGEIGDARAVEPLTKALGDDKSWVRDAAKEALRKLGHEVE